MLINQVLVDSILRTNYLTLTTIPIPYATVIMRDRLVLRYKTNKELQ
jgi:hypothetical protein